MNLTIKWGHDSEHPEGTGVYVGVDMSAPLIGATLIDRVAPSGRHYREITLRMNEGDHPHEGADWTVNGAAIHLDWHYTAAGVTTFRVELSEEQIRTIKGN